MVIFRNKIEELDTKEILESEFLNWNDYKDCTVMITGATGLIGTQLVKTFLYANEVFNANINIVIAIRNKAKAKNIFGKFIQIY